MSDRGSAAYKMWIAFIIVAMLVLLIVLPIVTGEWFPKHDSVSPSECINCHKLDEIGIFTTTGQPISQEYEWQSRLHQSLKSPDCLECHIIHGNEPQPFQHGLLNNSINNECALCHIDSVPGDVLHQTAGTGCGICHSPTTWSVDHSQYFVFDKKHPPTCSDCHLDSSDYSQYSCYGTCHTHQEEVMPIKHREVDNYNYHNCADEGCHSSGNDD